MNIRGIYEKFWVEGSLGRRLSVLIGSLIALLAIIAFFVTPGHIERQMRRASRQAAGSIAEMAAHVAGPGLAANDMNAVRRVLSDVRHVDGVLRVAVLDSARTVVAEAGPGGPPSIPAQTGLLRGGRAYGVFAPLSRQRGQLYLEMSFENVRRAALFSRLFIGVLYGLLVGLGGVLAVGISRHVMKPVVELVEVTRDIAGGNWRRRARMDGPHEMVALAQAVNTMVVELARARREMEGRNADLRRRSLELALAKEHAEEAVRLRDAFLTNMSHEVRTPLAGILGTAQVLRDEVDGPAGELVDILEASGQRLLGTLNDVLELSQLQSNTLRVDMRAAEIHAVAEECAEALRTAAEQKGLSFVVEACMQPLYAEIDGAAFGRVMNHLIGNAIKFTDAGSVRVRVGNDVGSVFVMVSDTGIGIVPEQLPHLFEPFRQGSTGLARTHEGNGVGLAIARHYVQRMRGTIEAESAPGKGSTFTIRLPRVRVRSGGFDGSTWPDEEAFVEWSVAPGASA